MATAGPSPGTTFANDATVGSTVWVNPGNAAADDGSYAVVDTTGSFDDITEYLKATGFGFSIPGGATINGIEAGVKRITDTVGLPLDYSIKIVKGGVISGNEQSTSSAWPTSEATKVFGTPSDLWGLAWTPADINSATFGVVVAATDSGSVGNWIAKINYITLTITYTPASTGGLTLALLGVGS